MKLQHLIELFQMAGRRIATSTEASVENLIYYVGTIRIRHSKVLLLRFTSAKIIHFSKRCK